MPKIWNKKPIAALQAEAAEIEIQELMTHGSVPLKRTLSAMSLTALGIGNIIGAGIFVLIGQAAAAHAGPAIGLSFLVSAIACAFAGMCYAEMALGIGRGRGSEYDRRQKRESGKEAGASRGQGGLLTWFLSYLLVV